MSWLVLGYLVFSTTFFFLAIHVVNPEKLSPFKKVVALLLAGPVAWSFLLCGLLVYWLDGGES